MPKEPPTLQHDVVLAPYTTLKIGGPAKYFAAPTSLAEVQEVIAWAHQQAIPFRILGRGANTLIADRGFEGLVVVMLNDQLVWDPPRVVAGAGVQNGQLIANALKHGLGGMRWLIGVPGTVGGSLYGNAGGHGWGLGDQVEWVEVITVQGQLKRLTKEECQFAYRTSIFKSHPEWVIVQAQLTLPTVDAVAERNVLAATTKQKNANQPTTAKTAGCMFTNPVADLSRLPAHLREHVDETGKIAAWRVIHEVGLKGKTIGQIQISELHSNFMINLGGGTADQVMQLLSLVKQQVRDKLGMQLHEEVQYLGF